MAKKISGAKTSATVAAVYDRRSPDDDPPRRSQTAATTARPSALVDTRVIYCGDNLDQLKKLPDGCVDLEYIDPPFNSNRNYEIFWPETGEKRRFDDRHESTSRTANGAASATRKNFRRKKSGTCSSSSPNCTNRSRRRDWRRAGRRGCLNMASFVLSRARINGC
jgi:hypothetical protein